MKNKDPSDSFPKVPSTKIPYYLRLLSYMLLDWAQILNGSGFFWRVPSIGGSWGRLGRGWDGGGGAADSLSMAWEAWRGESVWTLRWLETLCWELPWLSLRSNCCCEEREIKKRWRETITREHHYSVTGSEARSIKECTRQREQERSPWRHQTLNMNLIHSMTIQAFKEFYSSILRECHQT